MSQVQRLMDAGLVDRTRPISFQFDGRTYQGYHGDTLASALLANGIKLIGRSFKYHRPRGIVTAGTEDPNAYVQLGRGGRDTPNQQATVVELTDGLIAESVNCWPSPGFDVMAVNSLLSRIFVAGFYYKTFMWPKTGWHFYEWFIRRAAGLGTPPTTTDTDIYDKMNAHCDVIIVGAGPAGLMAALEAGRSGARVILCDMKNQLGGQLLDETMMINGKPALDWVANAEAELAAMPEVRILTRTSAFGYFDHNFLGLVENRADHESDFVHKGAKPGTSRQRIWRVRAKQVVLATGAIERPLIFADNDRPGCMTAGAVRAYVNRYGVSPGKRTVVFTNNDDAYRTALDLKAAGGTVVAVVDVRANPHGELVTRTIEAGIEVIPDSGIVGVKGSKAIKDVRIMNLTKDGDAVLAPARTLECDVIASSGGWNPAVHLHSHSGGKPIYDAEYGTFVPGKTMQAERSAGASKGVFDLAITLQEGSDAGRDAVKAAGIKLPRARAIPKTDEPDEEPWRHMWVVPAEVPVGHGPKHFIDQHGDVTVADVQLAAREGYQSVEHAKRYTTMGMGADQGKTGNIPGMAVLSAAIGKDIPDVGTTTFRPPFTPVPFGAIAGRDIGQQLDATRRSPMHVWHERAGAYWEDVGQWKRPWYFPHAHESMRDAVNRECLAVRNTVGILDASTLGKIDIQGPDAAEFLNRIYTNAWLKLDIGKCRYGFMLGEDGMIFDDGVTARLGDNHYLMHTTSGGAARVLGWLEEYAQTEWPDLKVYFNSVTEQWATLSLAGPNARVLLSEFTDLDLSNDAFPFMSVKNAVVGGIAARVFRISFTGELSFEVNVPAHAALGLWTQFMLAGEKYGITPYGTETMHVLRAEKGFVIVGQDTDGTITPDDLGMDWIVSKKKPDFIGKRSLSRVDTARTDRKQLVGLVTEEPHEVLPEGGQVVADADLKPDPPMAMIGHVTSSYYSAHLGHSIALAVIDNGRARHGERVHVPLIGKTIAATVTSPAFYDPKGERANG